MTTLIDLDERFIVLKDLFTEGLVSEESYHKAAVEMACDYWESGFPQRTSHLLETVGDSEYYNEAFKRHLAQDPLFVEKVYTLCLGLVDTGIVETKDASLEELFCSMAMSSATKTGKA